MTARNLVSMYETVTVARLIEMLQELPNQQARVYVHDPAEEISGTIRSWVGDIYMPTDDTEVYILADFG